jgi:type IV secretion system protein VirB10
LSERTRAQKARNVSFSSQSFSTESSTTDAKSLKMAELQKRRERISARTSENGSTKQRLAAVRQKTMEAKALKERLTDGEFTASNLSDLTAELRNLQANGPTSGTSQVKNIDGSRRTVGATVDKAQELGIQGVKLPTGYVIKANLGQTTISDYSNGSFKAQIGQDVYDADYETILFPKGTVIDGRTVQLSNVNEPIQARGGMIVNYFVLPNGNRIDMRKSAGALDAMGIAGLKDDVNYHFLAQFLGVAAYAVISSQTASATSSQFTGDTNIGGDINQNLRKQLQPLASRYLTLVPTITLNTGLPMTIYIEDEIILEPWGTIYDNLL